MTSSDADRVNLLAHLWGMKWRGHVAADICHAAAKLVRLLPSGSLELTDDAEEALKGNVNHLGIRLTSSDHVVDLVDKLAGDEPLFRDVMTYLVHD